MKDVYGPVALLTLALVAWLVHSSSQPRGQAEEAPAQQRVMADSRSLDSVEAHRHRTNQPRHWISMALRR